MATRSDFAHKLLNDLRMRREQINASQSLNHSSRVAGGDVRGNMSQNYEGFRQIKASQSVGSGSTSSQRRSNNSTRSLNLEETLNQLVPFGGGRNSQKIGDLSMALTFALEHGVELRKLDSSGNRSTLGFLHGKMERNSSSFPMNETSSRFLPTLSQLHIKEISKGAEKLNQILRACSNSMNFDGYSIEIGKELLKGATDLQESLKMLVNLQEASEYMKPPQRKNRIRLLEEGEEEEESAFTISEQKQVDRPRFSFDKPSRTVTNIYTNEAPSFSRKQAVSNLTLVTHKRSASFGADFKALVAFSELKDHTSSSHAKTDEGRIPNVIAKLMGLEELPKVVDSKSAVKESSSKQKEERASKKIPHASTQNVVRPLVVEKKSVQSNNTRATKSSSSVSKSRDIQATQNAISELAVPNGKMIRNDKQSDLGQLTKFMGSQNDFRDVRREDKAKFRGQLSMENEETKQTLQKNEVHKHKSSKAANIDGGKESTLPDENRNRIPPGNQKKPKYDHGMHQEHTQQKSELQEHNNQAEKKEQQHHEQKVSFIRQKGIEGDPSKSTHVATSLQTKQQYAKEKLTNKRISKPMAKQALKGLQNSKKREPTTYGNSTIRAINSKNGNSDHNVCPGELGSEKDNTEVRVLPVTQEKHIHFPITQKKDGQTKVRKSETYRNIHKVLTRRNETLRNSRTLKHQVQILQGMKHKKLEKTSPSKDAQKISSSLFKKATTYDSSTKKSEASIRAMNGALQQNKESEEEPNLYSSGADEHQSQSITQFPTTNESCQIEALGPSTVHNDSQYQEAFFIEDRELVSLESALSQRKGASGGNTEISYISPHEHMKTQTPGTQELLTANEIVLKKILIKSQLFMNTAEALFKLKIPFNVLPVTEYSSQDVYSNIILDCGFEIMKRKGRRQELALHPHLHISIISTKVISLDDLVKQLYKDLENLKLYDRIDCDEHNEAEYMHKMLERDVQNRDPGVNSTWDMGWNDMMFAILDKDELVKDLERYLLNRLIDETMKDLLDLSVFYFIEE